MIDQNLKFGDIYRSIDKSKIFCNDQISLLNQVNKDLIMDQ